MKTTKTHMLSDGRLSNCSNNILKRLTLVNCYYLIFFKHASVCFSCVQRRKISESTTGRTEGSLSVSPNHLLFVTPRSDSPAAVSSIRTTCMKTRFDSTRLVSTLTTPDSVPDASKHENDGYGKAYNIPLQSMNHQDQRLDNDYDYDIGTKKLTLLPEAQYREWSYGGGNIAYPNMFGLMNKKPLNYKQTLMDNYSPQGDMK